MLILQELPKIEPASPFAWIGYGITAIAVLLGTAKLAEILLLRKLQKSDQVEGVHISNQGEKIKADVTLVQSLLERVKQLEAGQKETTEKLMALTSTNSRLTAENKFLHETNIDQKEQIRRLTDQLNEVRSKFEELLAHFRSIGGTIPKSILTKSEKQLLRTKKNWDPIKTVPVIVVDDDEDSRELVKVAFSQLNIECQTFDSSTVALDWLDKNEARVVILDLAMPVLDGLSMAGHIRTNEGLYIGRHPSILYFMTGHPVTEEITKAAEQHDVKSIYIKGDNDIMEICEFITKLMNSKK